MTYQREIMLKKNLLKKSLREGKIEQTAFDLAIKKLDEKLELELQKKVTNEKKLNLFREKMVNRG